MTGGDLVLQLIAAAGGGAALVLFLLRYFGDKWFEGLLKRRQTEFEHKLRIEIADADRSHQREMQSLRSRIEILQSSANRLTEREFTVVPDAWSEANEAYWLAGAITSPFVVGKPDIGLFDEASLKDLFQSLDMPDRYQRPIFASQPAERSAMFAKWLDRNRLKQAMDRCSNARRLVAKSSLFMGDELHAKFEEFIQLTFQALVEEESQQLFVPSPPYDRTFRDMLYKTGPKLQKELRSVIRARLWRADGQA